MIPLRDNIPSRTTPYVTWALLAANVVAFLVQLSAPNAIQEFGVKPSYLEASLRDEPAVDARVGVNPITGQPALVPYLTEEPPSVFDAFSRFFTSMFLHAGFMHIAFNMLFLWIFGDNVEDHFGHVRFLIFYVVCGVAAAALHAVTDLDSPIPMVGASGAIAGVLGAYLVRFPRARVLTLLPIFAIISLIEVPALFFLGLWFLIQVMQGLGGTGGNVAVWAHAGGFVVGAGIMLLARRAERPPDRRPPYRDAQFELIR